MRFSNSIRGLLLVALHLLFIVEIAAQVIALDAFDSYALGLLRNGASGGSGWTSNWDVSGTNSSIVDLSVVLPGQAYETGDHALSFSGNNNAPVIRDFSTQTDSLFVSYEFTLLSGTVNNNDFASLWFETHQYPNGPNIGVKGNSATNTPSSPDFFARTQGGSEAFAFPDLETGTTYFIVGELFKSGGSSNYDRFSLWINPDSDDAASPLASSSSDSGYSSIDSLGWRLVNLDGDDQVLINNLALGSSWENVVPMAVPEPATYVLSFGILSLAFVLIRKRKSTPTRHK